MVKMDEMSLKVFGDTLASNSPVPGGGSVGALAGSLSAALASMVASLTIGKKGYEEHYKEMENVKIECEKLRSELMELIQKDSDSFDLVMKAMAMPKDTEEQKEIRRTAMQEGFKAAACTPMESAETAMKILAFSKKTVANGNKNAVTDGLVSAMMARTAVLSCLLNVKINLGSIKDTVFVDDMNKRIAKLEKDAIIAETEIFKLSDLTSHL